MIQGMSVKKRDTGEDDVMILEVLISWTIRADWICPSRHLRLSGFSRGCTMSNWLIMKRSNTRDIKIRSKMVQVELGHWNYLRTSFSAEF
jgi:hypothetical protein